MFDMLFESKFHAKCKSYIKLTKTRLVTIKKKRNAVEKYLKNDVADLLRSSLDYNAYGRAEAILVEQNITSCYYLIEQFCDCISNRLSAMNKQRECPEDLREAVASLMYAAARFSDLPELRDLRSLFTRKYGSSIESYINKEFHEKLKAMPATKDMKLQLMQGIAHEIFIDWDSKALEQKLFFPPPPSGQVQQNHQQLSNDNGRKVKDDYLLKQHDEDARYKLSDQREQLKSERNGTYNQYSSSGDEVATISTASSGDSTDLDGSKSSDSVASVSDDSSETKRPIPYRFIPPPYIKQSKGKCLNNLMEETNRTSCAGEDGNRQNESAAESYPTPRSVRRRPFKPPPGHGDVQSGESNRGGGHISQCIHADADGRTDEDQRMDELLTYYSNKRSPYVDKEIKDEQPSMHEHVDDISYTRRPIGTKPEPFIRPARGLSLPPDPTSPKMPTAIHSRATSLQPDMLAGHVHPKLPDYDDLAARFSALRGK